MYMNCAVVDIKAAGDSKEQGAGEVGSAEDVGASAQAALGTHSDLYVANLKGINDCTTKETVDVCFPDPGSDVIYGDGMSESCNSHSSKDSCTWVGGKSTDDASSASSSSTSAEILPEGSDSQGSNDSVNSQKTDSNRGPSTSLQCSDGQWHPECYVKDSQESQNAVAIEQSSSSQDDPESAAAKASLEGDAEAHPKTEPDESDASADTAGTDDQLPATSNGRTRPAEFYDVNADKGNVNEREGDFPTVESTSSPSSTNSNSACPAPRETDSSQQDSAVDQDKPEAENLPDTDDSPDSNIYPQAENPVPFDDISNPGLPVDALDDDSFNVDRAQQHQNGRRQDDSSSCSSVEPLTVWVPRTENAYSRHYQPHHSHHTSDSSSSSDSSDSSDEECHRPVWRCKGCHSPNRCVKINRCTRTCTHFPYTRKYCYWL